MTDKIHAGSHACTCVESSSLFRLHMARARMPHQGERQQDDEEADAAAGDAQHPLHPCSRREADAWGPRRATLTGGEGEECTGLGHMRNSSHAGISALTACCASQSAYDTPSGASRASSTYLHAPTLQQLSHTGVTHIGCWWQQPRRSNASMLLRSPVIEDLLDGVGQRVIALIHHRSRLSRARVAAFVRVHQPGHPEVVCAHLARPRVLPDLGPMHSVVRRPGLLRCMQRLGRLP